MHVTYGSDEKIYSIHWRDAILLLESSVVKKLKIPFLLKTHIQI